MRVLWRGRAVTATSSPPREWGGAPGGPEAGKEAGAGGDRHQLAPQVVGGGAGDTDVGEGAGGRDGTVDREVDQLVLAGPPGGHRRILFRGSLDEHVLDPADA